ncbi:hypothetical protein CB1_001748008 [Camelus ferus]|nr:hypothetical protein CB1_001748008 [Camelus ferus]
MRRLMSEVNRARARVWGEAARKMPPVGDDMLSFHPSGTMQLPDTHKLEKTESHKMKDNPNGKTAAVQQGGQMLHKSYRDLQNKGNVRKKKRKRYIFGVITDRKENLLLHFQCHHFTHYN